MNAFHHGARLEEVVRALELGLSARWRRIDGGGVRSAILALLLRCLLCCAHFLFHDRAILLGGNARVGYIKLTCAIVFSNPLLQVLLLFLALLLALLAVAGVAMEELRSRS